MSSTPTKDLWLSLNSERVSAILQSLLIHLLVLLLLFWSSSRKLGQSEQKLVVLASIAEVQLLPSAAEQRKIKKSREIEDQSLLRQRELDAAQALAEAMIKRRETENQARMQSKREQFLANRSSREAKRIQDTELSKERRRQSRKSTSAFDSHRYRLLLFPGDGNLDQYGVWSLEHEWMALVSYEVHLNWQRPGYTVPGQSCLVNIVQTPPGFIEQVVVHPGCEIRRSIVDAVYRAEPLPYLGYESVFKPEIEFYFFVDAVQSIEINSVSN